MRRLPEPPLRTADVVVGCQLLAADAQVALACPSLLLGVVVRISASSLQLLNQDVAA
jgi:hypothetical protein